MSHFSAPEDVSSSTQPKQISSRLLNMKFMQRAAASSPSNSVKTPSTPSGQPSSKRRRTGDFTTTVGNLNSPTLSSTAASTPAYNERTAISSALAEDANGSSTKRGQKHFDTAGEETEWVLNIRLPVANGAHNSYDENNGELSDEIGEGEDEDVWSSSAPRGRQTYGSFDKKKRRTTNTTKSETTKTPTSTEKSSKKRPRPDFEAGGEVDDEDLSSIPSNSDLEDSSEDGEIEESPKLKNNKALGKFNFKSQEDLRKMDSFDFQKAGLEHGLGRQRPGLGGGGGGGEVVAAAAGGAGFGTSSHGRGSSKRPKKKAKKSM